MKKTDFSLFIKLWLAAVMVVGCGSPLDLKPMAGSISSKKDDAVGKTSHTTETPIVPDLDQGHLDDVVSGSSDLQQQAQTGSGSGSGTGSGSGSGSQPQQQQQTQQQQTQQQQQQQQQ